VADEPQVRAEDAHVDRLARAREHLVDPLVQVRLHVLEHAGKLGDRVLDRGACLVVGGRIAHRDPVLAEVDPDHFVGEVRLPDVRSDVGDTRNRVELALLRCHDPALFRKRGARLRDDVAEEVTLLERRNQRLSEKRHDRDSGHCGDGHDRVRPPRSMDHPRQNRRVAALERPYGDRVALVEPAPGEKDQAQRRRDRQSDEQRREHGQAIGEHERPEERARQAVQKVDGDQGRDDDQRRVDDRAPHLQRRFEDDARLRSPRGCRAVLAQAAPDVLDVDDRVVDDDAERDHEPCEHHHVDALAPCVEDERGRDEGERNRGDADQCRAPLEEEGAEHEHDEQRADQERDREVVQRGLDEVGRPEDVRVELDPGEAGLHLLQCRLHPAGDVEGVAPGVLLDDQQQAGVAVDDRVAHEPLRPLHDVGDVRQPHRPAGPLGDRHLGEVVRRDDRQDVLDGQPLVRRLDEAAGADPVSVRVPEQPCVQCG
jgi:hypothetical protein